MKHFIAKPVQDWRRAGAALIFLAGVSCAYGTDWPSDPRTSGSAYLSPDLRSLQNDMSNSPVGLIVDKGIALWSEQIGTAGKTCQSCHGPVASMKKSAANFPRLSANGQQLLNLEDQIMACQQRAGHVPIKHENEDVLALSAVLHLAAKGEVIHVAPLPHQSVQWQARLASGTALYMQRSGRMNLACVHCHDQNIGRHMRADVISPGNPTGFPIYRMSWQGMGSIDRRLRACYSGVQAIVPSAGDAVLRDLELYLKVRANGLVMEGPSIRR